MISEFESNITCVERIKEYSNTPHEVCLICSNLSKSFSFIYDIVTLLTIKF